jgi:hypothetical protein
VTWSNARAKKALWKGAIRADDWLRENRVRAQKPRIGRMTRSFFEFARPAPPPRPRWGSRLPTGRDTCFVNIVRRHRPLCLTSGSQQGSISHPEPQRKTSRKRRPRSASLLGDALGEVSHRDHPYYGVSIQHRQMPEPAEEHLIQRLGHRGVRLDRLRISGHPLSDR